MIVEKYRFPFSFSLKKLLMGIKLVKPSLALQLRIYPNNGIGFLVWRKSWVPNNFFQVTYF